MRTSVLSFLLLLAFAGTLFAVGGPVNSTATDTVVGSDTTFVSDLLGTTPFWLNVETSFICPPDHGPHTCSYDSDCQRYFGLPSNYVCMGPGGLCNGHCEPC